MHVQTCVHAKSFTQAKDCFLAQNVTEFDLLWLKQRWNSRVWTSFPNIPSHSLTPRQLHCNCCGSEPLELALKKKKKCCSFPKSAVNQSTVHRGGIFKGWYARTKASQTTTNAHQQIVTRGPRPLPATHLETATSLCSNLICLYALYYLGILTTRWIQIGYDNTW